ncbi:unnamed protein product, partial [Symbiodinium microadriaticum]
MMKSAAFSDQLARATNGAHKKAVFKMLCSAFPGEAQDLHRLCAKEVLALANFPPLLAKGAEDEREDFVKDLGHLACLLFDPNHSFKCLGDLCTAVAPLTSLKGEENERQVLALEGRGRQASLKLRKWCDLHVGSMVVVRQNEYVPADL